MDDHYGDIRSCVWRPALANHLIIPEVSSWPIVKNNHNKKFNEKTMLLSTSMTDSKINKQTTKKKAMSDFFCMDGLPVKKQTNKKTHFDIV